MHICMHCMDIPLQRTTNICTAGISAENIYSAQTLVSPRETAKRCYKMHPLLQIIADNCRRALWSAHVHQGPEHSAQAGHSKSDKPVWPSPFTQPLMSGVAVLLGFSLPDRFCLHTLPRSSQSLHTSFLCAATSALPHASHYQQQQFPAQKGDAVPGETALGRQLHTTEVSFLPLVAFHRPPQSSPQPPRG